MQYIVFYGFRKKLRFFIQKPLYMKYFMGKSANVW